MKRLINGLIVLPEPIKASITAVVVYLVSLLFANLILLAPFLVFLEQFKIPLALAIAMAVIAWIEKVVPDLYASVAIAALQLVLAILAVFGVGTALAAMGSLPALLSP